MTKDNWMKALIATVKLDPELEGRKGICLTMEELEAFIQNQIDLAIEKTNKRWRERIEKLKPLMEDDEETTVYRHCDEGDHWKCGGYGESGTCLCKCHALSNLSDERDKNV